MRNKVLLLLGASFVYVTSLATLPSSDMTREQYIRKYHEWAVKNMENNGVPASITLAQGILESRSGNSRLARKGNNHFGIKCHEWTGKRIYEHDDRRNECFRKYDSAYESFADHALFLSSRSRYRDLFELDVTDYKKWARGLKKSGYATDPNYAERLITIIEKHDLHRFDKGVSVSRRSGKSGDDYEVDPFVRHEVHHNNGVRYIKVKSGDTFSSIAAEFDLRDWELPTDNDLPSDDHEATDFSYLYIERKRNKAHPDHEQHVVKDGQTMFEISQIYGVKLKRL
ncbi:MAG: glucosaminidase domain-containing protein, partial [Marinilabilia sp.]